MYLDFWQLREEPFQNVGDIRFAYLSDQHKEGLARLLYLVDGRKLGGALTGPYGSGKSMILDLLEARVRDRGHTQMVRIDTPPAGALALARQVLAKMGLDTAIEETADALNKIELYARDKAAGGERLVLAIDEAQMLREPAMLEFLHLLTNLRVYPESPAQGQAAVTLLLAGHPDLMHALEEEASLRQRMQLYWQLDPLTEEQTEDYVRHRIEVAGGRASIFDRDAVAMLWKTSGGLPRVINNIGDIALLLGCAAQSRSVTADLVHRAALEVSQPGAAKA